MTDQIFDGEELVALARLDIEKGLVDAGLAKLKRALSQSDAPTEALRDAARVYSQLGLRKRALPLYEAYLAKTPSDIDVRFQQGMAHFEEGQTSLASDIWNEVLRAAPEYPPALYFQAVACLRGANQPGAIELLQRAVAKLPPDNLYFSKSRELLATVEADAAAAIQASPADARRIVQH